MNKFSKLILLILAIPKTLYFNFKYLKFADAILFPIIVSHRVKLSKVSGNININSKIQTGMIRIGFGGVAIFDASKSKTIWTVLGNICFQGKCSIGHGSKISVKEDGNLILGENFTISAESSIICKKRIEIGDNCLLSWDILIMDTDFHKVKDKNNTQLNRDKSIYIGNNVWIGCRSTILKGAFIGDGCVIGSNSLITKSYKYCNSILVGNPIKVMKEDILWEI